MKASRAFPEVGRTYAHSWISITHTDPETVGPKVSSQLPDPNFKLLLDTFEAKDFPGFMELLKKVPADYREPSLSNRTALFFAAKYDFREAAVHLVKKGASVDEQDDEGVTPLHMAARYLAVETVKHFLKFSKNPDMQDGGGRTPLHYTSRACREDMSDKAVTIIKLFLQAGAFHGTKDKDGRIPLHYAARAGSAEVVLCFLAGNGAQFVNSRDSDNWTPLHHAVEGSRSLKTVQILLHNEAMADAFDRNGRTPLHIVAERAINYVDEKFDSLCMEMLLKQGANVSAKNDEGENALSLVLKRTMWWHRQSPKDVIFQMVQMLVAKGSGIIDGFDMWRMVESFPSLVMIVLNQSIKASTSLRDSPQLRLIVDVRPLTSKHRLLLVKQCPSALPPNQQLALPPPPLLADTEISVMHYIYWAGHGDILRHPLCAAFLHQKWLKVRKFFLLTTMFYFLFSLCFTTFILTMEMCVDTVYKNITVYSANVQAPDPEFNATCQWSQDSHSLLRTVFWWALAAFWSVLVIKEIIQISMYPLIYFKHTENYIDLVQVTCTPVVLLLSCPCLAQTLNCIAAVATVAAWCRLMLCFGQFPTCGVYVVMLSTVAKNVIRFIGIFLCFILAFSLGFFILLKPNTSYRSWPVSFMSTIVMMTGELDYEDNFLASDKITLSFTLILLLAFILLIFITLSNLLVGLAISDMYVIQQRSELIRLKRQVELMVQVETFIHSWLIPRFLLKYLEKKLSVTHGLPDPKFTIYPNRRPSLTERVYICVARFLGNDLLVTKLFEHFIPGFIAPEMEPQFPKDLVKEATQIALTELEIEKRDKLLHCKAHQMRSLRNHVSSRNGKPKFALQPWQRSDIRLTLRQLPSLQVEKDMTTLASLKGDPQRIPLLWAFPEAEEELQNRSSLRASSWRANLQRELSEEEDDTEALEEFRLTERFGMKIQEALSKLQNTIDAIAKK